ncbi:anthranilate phosphoribosyltransferase, TrpD [Multifurca ochricompacta]|uniref:Anthranilate phosphoribosyltransferase n=1 Tax=Multifurca ochricompacta TaxID=376703 RepID=A0AAD4LWY1_9AGAM|nr:anthranilate phosphoribosyltransferase, TrpD [Multifurca ochricompacta]
MPDLSPTTFRPILSKLIKSPQDFGTADIETALDHVITPGAALPEQVGAFLTGIAVARVELQKELIISAAAFIYSRSIPAIVFNANNDSIVDIVGTGGDGHNTFNVSTTAAIVAAGAGARVIKHGSRASTSTSGSADLLQALGCVFTPPRAIAPSPIPSIPFAFILAPHYHPALATLAPARRALPFRTLFNVLGPLLNPARPRGMVLGVAEPALGPPFVAALKAAGVKRAYVVCGAEGLDEISCAGDTHVWELLEDGGIKEQTLCPADFGLPPHPLSDVKSGTPAENAAVFKALLTSGYNVPKHLTPILDFVLLNAAALLVIAGVADSFRDGVSLAREAITSGKAWRALETLRDHGLKESVEAEVTV